MDEVQGSPTARQWADLSMDMWALICNSIAFDPNHAGVWEEAKIRLSGRFHEMLPKTIGDPDGPRD